MLSHEEGIALRTEDSLKRLARNERGNVLMIGAACMPLLMGAAAISLDVIQVAYWKRQLQRAADSGALAGAHAVAQLKSPSVAVTRDLQLNGDVPQITPAVVENRPTSGSYMSDSRAVRVTITSQPFMPFMAFFDSAPTIITATATATSVVLGKYCMISLEDGNNTGIRFSGNSNAQLGCGIATNSKSQSAIVADGSARVVASPLAAVGNIPSSSAYVQPTTLMPYTGQQPNPFADLPLPTPGSCNSGINIQPNQSRTIGPGCYTGMDIQGTLNLEPGTYYVNELPLNIQATGRLNGTGVTIVLTSPTPTISTSFSTLSVHGNARVNLTAATTGTFANLLFYGDPRAPVGIMNTVTGNNQSSYNGGMYFKHQDLTFLGNAQMETNCIQLVARRITLSGNTRINNTCSTTGPRAYNAAFVRLVE